MSYEKPEIRAVDYELPHALVIHRDIDGNWPLYIIEALEAAGFDAFSVQAAIELSVHAALGGIGDA